MIGKSEAEKILLEMLVKGEIVGYGLSGREITIFILKNKSSVVDRIREVFGDTGFDITIVEVEEIKSLDIERN